MNILHELFGQHAPKVEFNHWEDGNFVSRCIVCDCVIMRLPGLPWRKSPNQSKTAKV